MQASTNQKWFRMSTIGNEVALEFAKSAKGKAISRIEDKIRVFEIEIQRKLEHWTPEIMIDFLSSITAAGEKGARVKKSLLVLKLKGQGVFLDKVSSTVSA